jgi:hypothetical protein
VSWIEGKEVLRKENQKQFTGKEIQMRGVFVLFIFG